MSNLHKVGILGGTLDPIHLGHLIIAQSAMQELSLEKVVFMPSGNPPHKTGQKVTDAYKRLDMVRLAIDNNDNFVYSDFEMRREGIIYTSDTLELLKSKYKEVEFYFIMGADSLFAIETWHKPEKIFQLCRIVVADRDMSNEKLADRIEYIENKYNIRIFHIDSPFIHISSSYIRDCVKNGISIRYLVCDKVANYIFKNNIYNM